MIRMEREIVGHMQHGNQRGYDDAMLVSPQLRIWTEDRHPALNRSQRQAVDEIFLSREKIVGLDGVAGAGKTTTLSVVREGAEAQGYKVEGFAPTSRAAHKLAEAGMETSTLQRHLAKGTQPDTGEKRLYVLDESSLASTRQMHEFIERLHPNDRVLLVGDTRQHESVEAGRIFAQLQEAGMRTVKLDEIVRQRDPELKHTVEQLAHGQVGAAVESLDRQGRVHQVKGHEERVAAIAVEYAKSPESTLVVSPDNRSRTEINQKIHDELQSRGVVSREEHSVQTLVPRQEMTGADRSWAQQYQVNDIVRYSRSSQETGIEKGEYTRVVSVNARENTLTVVRTNGEQTTYDPRRQMGVSVYREQEKAFSVGDRIQFTAPNQELKIANRELGNERVLLGFRNAYVFDISQTDGVELPNLHEVSGDPGENIDGLAAFVKSKGIQLVYNANLAPALGMSYGGRIAILPGQSKAEEFSTLVHETAHELLHKAERRTATTKTVRETEAEAVAFVVGKAVGLVAGTASADYIQLYHGNASLLAESLEVIQQTARFILASLEPPIADAVTNEATKFAEVA